MIKGKQIEDSSISKEKLNLQPATLSKDPIRKSEFDNRKINGKSLATDITLDNDDIGLGNIPNLLPANWPISNATQAALDALEDEIQIIEDNVNDTLDEINDIIDDLGGAGDRIDDLYTLWDQLFTQAFPDVSPDEYLNTNTFATGTNGTGATTNASTKTITINNGSNGAGASLTQRLDLSLTPDNKIGEEIKFRLIFNESQLNMINDKMKITLSVNSIDTPITYTPYILTGTTTFLVYEFSHIVGALNEVLDVKFNIESDAPNQNITGNIIWIFFGYVNANSRYNTIVQKTADTLKDAAYQYTFFERRVRTSKADNTNTIDEYQRVQDELYDAMDTSGIYLLPKGTIKIGTQLILSDAIRIEGIGDGTVLNADLNGGLFSGATNKKIILKNFQASRLNGSKNPSLIIFNPSFINVDSVIEGLTLSGFTDALFVDYTRGINISDCTFIAGVRGLIIGNTDLGISTSNVKVEGNTFHAMSQYDIFSAAGNNILINHNIFEKHPTIGGYSARNIQFSLNGATTFNNINITNNLSKAFSQYAIRVSIDGASTVLDGLVVANNILKDASPNTASANIYLSSITNGNLKNTLIESNIITNKNIAINTKGINTLSVNSNIITKETGTWATSRPMYIESCTNFIYGLNNISTDQANPILIL